jgi:phospholipase C
MQSHRRCLLLLILLGATIAYAQAPFFQHIVIVFQENRTPDNLFGSNPTFVPGVDLRGNGSHNAPDCDGSEGGIPLRAANLVTCYDVAHWHSSFTSMWNNGNMNGSCLIQILNPNCGVPTCPVHMSNHMRCPQYQYVDNSAKTVQPYFDIATYYGFANYMFASNQGPSFPAHQFILSGTSAPDVPGDQFSDWFAADNPFGSSTSGLHCTYERIRERD